MVQLAIHLAYVPNILVPAAVKGVVLDMLTALQYVIPVVVALFIITKALGERAEIKLLIGEGILAAVGLELLFAFAKSFLN
jgi:hypothetical protein